ncbi:hypothetical protein VSDG_06490 [Cytospora chrysosperma]|uniref:Uncharacterized protein n=1 Tax=Cytospora chrysosperma TaxID=252740 RepID=A0A423VLB3_CYTCH|nr:hypothetical protein VSDG_06490 [Valsa sordida]
MGGKAFASGRNPLYTPRMALAVYEHVKKQCTSALKTLFPRAETPIEAPEKASFGDVDIFVSFEGSNLSRGTFTSPSAWTPIQTALQGVRSNYEARADSERKRVINAMSFAIPWPTDLSAGERAAQMLVEASLPAATVANRDSLREDGDVGGAGDGPKDRYIQVDVRVCDSDQELDWRLFKHHHGDLWNMLGQIIRPVGLTADDTSLSIRIPEIEMENKKGCRVFLTSSPTETLDFLGLSHQNGEWERPFKSVEELFKYAASCRWYAPAPWPGDKKAARDSDHAQKLDPGDRARMAQRPLFARWVNEPTPPGRGQGRSPTPAPDPKDNSKDKSRGPASLRDEVRLQAFRAFPGSETAYAATLAAWRREKVRIYVKAKVIREDMCLPADVSHVLPAPQEGASVADIERNWRGVIHSALAKIVINDDEGFGGIVPPRLRDDQGVLVVEDVKDWINRNWEEVGRVAWEIYLANARASMEAKSKLAEEEAAAAADEGKAADNNANNA